MSTKHIKNDGSGLGPNPNKVKSSDELVNQRNLINWQIGFACEGILRYRKLGLKEMEAWNRGRLAAAKSILGNMEFCKEEAYKAFKSCR
jgi:hypothetical protein